MRPRSRSSALNSRGSRQRHVLSPGPTSSGNGGGRSGTIAPSGLNGNVASQRDRRGRSCALSIPSSPAREVLAIARDPARVDLRRAQLSPRIPSTGKRHRAWTSPSTTSVASQDVLPRADAVVHARLRAVRRARHRRRDHRRGRRARRGHARLQRGAGRAGRLRVRDVLALEQARPRRPALPAELRPRARPRGAAGAPDQRQPGAAPGAAAALRRARVRRRAAGPARRARPQRLRRDGGRPGAPLAARPPARARGARLEPDPPPRDLRRRTCSSCCRRSPTARRPAATSSTTARPTTCGWS